MVEIKTLQDAIEHFVIYPSRFAVVSMHIWLPFVFFAYAIGRRKWSKWLPLIFIVVESIALAISSYAAGLLAI